MPLTKDTRLFHNWFLRGKVASALDKHEADGKMPDKHHVYVGDTHRIQDVVHEFEKSAKATDVASTRLYARLSCRNGDSRKYHVVSLYQTERDKAGEQKQVLEVTWTPRGRTPLQKVVDEIAQAFAGLIRTNQKYGQKPPEIVGPLHEFQPGMKHPPRRVK